MSWEVRAKTYVQFYGFEGCGHCQGSFWGPQEIMVTSRRLAEITIPPGTVRFRFYSRWVAEMTINGGSIQSFESPPISGSESQWYYVNVVVLTPDEAVGQATTADQQRRRFKRLDYLTDSEEQKQAFLPGYRCVTGTSRRVYVVAPRDTILSPREPGLEELVAL